jgi:hypothetical protein
LIGLKGINAIAIVLENAFVIDLGLEFDNGDDYDCDDYEINIAHDNEAWGGMTGINESDNFEKIDGFGKRNEHNKIIKTMTLKTRAFDDISKLELSKMKFGGKVIKTNQTKNIN